jgi:hypothetical protein
MGRIISGLTCDWATGTQPTPPSFLAPDQITSANLIFWGRVPESIQMAVTLTGTGTTPRTVTISSASTLVGRTDGVFIDIQTTGNPGTGTFRISLDNGSTFVASGVTIPSGAGNYSVPTTDYTINFQQSLSYNADNTYFVVANRFLDKLGGYPTSLNNYENLGTGAPLTADSRAMIIANGSLGAPCLRFDGVNDFYESTTGSLATTVYGGSNKQYCNLFLTNILALPGSNAVFVHFASNLTDTAQPFIRMGISSTGPAWIAGRQKDGGGGSASALSSVRPFTGPALIEDSYDGTFRRVGWNTADMIGGDSGIISNQSVASPVTTTRSILGCQRVQSGISQFCNFDLYEAITFDKRPNDAEMALLFNYFNS